jgi:hypothetical protein
MGIGIPHRYPISYEVPQLFVEAVKQGYTPHIQISEDGKYLGGFLALGATVKCYDMQLGEVE